MVKIFSKTMAKAYKTPAKIRIAKGRVYCDNATPNTKLRIGVPMK